MGEIKEKGACRILIQLIKGDILVIGGPTEKPIVLMRLCKVFPGAWDSLWRLIGSMKCEKKIVVNKWEES